MTPASKGVLVIAGVSKTAAATATGTMDCLGFKAATINLSLTAADGTTTASKSTVMKLSESDDNTTFTDITVAVGGGTGGFTIPAAQTTDGIVAKFNVDLRGRKRYLKVTVSPATTQVVACIADLFRGESMPDTYGEAGSHVLVDL